MKFAMPADIKSRIQIHEQMLSRIQADLDQISQFRPQLTQELDRRIKSGENIGELKKKSIKLHRDELCLIDQAKRLRKKIQEEGGLCAE